MARGDEFKYLIRDICIAAGYDPIDEFIVRGKRADLAFEIDVGPGPARVVVEAKDYSDRVSKSVVEGVVGGYVAAVQSREIDQVWVIASNDFSSEARELLKNNVNFFPLTYSQFVRRLINFPRYVQYLDQTIGQDGIRKYYVAQDFESAGDALTSLREWHSSEDMTPIAVLSTYGMGKSSLAKMFASHLIKESRANSLARVPILIRLGDLSTHHQIDALIATLFTTKTQIGGYSFPLFQKLNELGLLTIIFDGLDEMRHAMTWSDFQFNFQEISKLITSNTKCILLGRPNTFQTKEEYRSVIDGSSFAAGHIYKRPDAVSFKAMNLMPFA